MASAKDIIRRLRDLQKLHVKAGVLKGATYPDTGESVAEVAMKNEYGSPTNPPRPFMRTTVREKRQFWLDGFGKLLNAYLDGRIPLRAIGIKMGVAMQTGIVETIDSNMPPPNSPKTIAAKVARGTAVPTTLIDSGTMRDSISYDYEI